MSLRQLVTGMALEIASEAQLYASSVTEVHDRSVSFLGSTVKQRSICFFVGSSWRNALSHEAQHFFVRGRSGVFVSTLS